MQHTICGHDPPDRGHHTDKPAPSIPTTEGPGNETRNGTETDDDPEVVVHRRKKRSADIESGLLDDFHFGKLNKM